jgi:hypothetical protein
MSQAGSFISGSGPGSGTVKTLTGNTEGAVPPNGAGNIDVVGNGTTTTVVGDPGTNTLTINTTGAVAASFPTDSNTAIPSGGALTIHGGHDINTSGAGSTVTINLNNAITLGDLTPIAAGSPAMTAVTGDVDIEAGNLNLPLTNTGGTQGVITIGAGSPSGAMRIHNYNPNSAYNNNNIFIGNTAGNFTLSTPANANVGVGSSCFISLTTGHDSVAFGYAALASSTADVGNTAIGCNSCALLNGGSFNTVLGFETLGNGSASLSGSYNLLAGYQAGINYTTSESNNIIFGSPGTIGQSNALVIGNGTGTGTQQLSSATIAGIYGSTVGATNAAVFIDSTGLLGTVGGSGGSGIVTIDGNTASVTGSTVTIEATESSGGFTGSGTTMTLTFTQGTQNTFVGGFSGNLGASPTGSFNSGFGFNSLGSITTSSENSAFGRYALATLSGGSGDNTAVGYSAIQQLTSGVQNTVVGSRSFANAVTSSDCTILGYSSGSSYTGAEFNNIIIGASVAGTTGESNVTRIGNTSTDNVFITGIHGVTVTGTAVLCDTNGQLGTVVSSERYKENIEDMGISSDHIYDLRPVAFTYKKDELKTLQYGLIAEQVQQIMPSLVLYGQDGRPQAVKYQDLPVLLLNELQKQQKIIDKLSKKVSLLEEELYKWDNKMF